MAIKLTQKNNVVDLSAPTSGTSDYNKLNNKPCINGNELKGNLTTEDLGIEAAGGLKDVKINDTSIVTDGVANIPIANSGTNGRVGLVKTETYLGLSLDSKTGNMSLYKCGNSHIDDRDNRCFAINTQNYDRAVKNHLTDGKAAEYTSEEKASARNRLGLDLEPIVIDIETTEEVKAIEIAEHDGKSLSDYDFKQMWVYVESVGGGSANNSEVQFLINGYEANVFPYLSVPTGLINNANKVYWGGYLDIRNGLCLSNIAYSVALVHRANAQMSQGSYLMLFENNINNIRIRSISTVIPIGTKFKVVLR